MRDGLFVAVDRWHDAVMATGIRCSSLSLWSKYQTEMVETSNEKEQNKHEHVQQYKRLTDAKSRSK